MSIGIITAIFGDVDNLTELPKNHGFDEAVCYTDNANLSSETWNVVYYESSYEDKVLASREMKHRPYKFLNTDKSVWMDGSCQILSRNFKNDILKYLEKNDLIVWKHPESMEYHPALGRFPNVRNCIYREAELCAAGGKWSKYNINDQIKYYESQGMPKDFGLWACGTIARNHTEDIINFGDEWFSHNVEWNPQDQISFGYLVWKNNPNISTFPHIQFDTDSWVTWNHHKK